MVISGIVSNLQPMPRPIQQRIEQCQSNDTRIDTFQKFGVTGFYESA